MRRRDFIGVLAGAAAAWPLAAHGQQPRIWRIGFLAGGSRPIGLDSSPYAGFLQGMRELGYAEGKDFVMEWRFAEGRPDLYPDLAAELVRLKVDIIVLGLGTAAVLSATLQATRTIPIVMGDSTDPLDTGFVASLAHPGGTLTGVTSLRQDTVPKQVELLATIVPNLRRLGFVTDPGNEGHARLQKVVEASAEKAGLVLTVAQMGDIEIMPRAFAGLTDAQVGAALFPADAFFFAQRQRISDLAKKSRLPTMFTQREYAEAGGLMSYGENIADFFRRAASFVDKIFKGAKPGDLPIEQPTKFNLVINRKTADALGVTIPPQLYIFADEVIE
jgi:putative tryptophan/tyrosine transport system substrate-binding protein